MMLYEPIVSDTIGYGKRKLWVFPLFVISVMVPISRMYLGVHSANQILFGLSLGFCFLVLYKYIYQKALYELYWEMVLGPMKLVKILGIVLLNLIVIAIPMIFFQVNADQRPMLDKDLINLNLRCGTKLTGLEIQEHMLTACAIGCVAFGLLYGFILLSNQRQYKKYILGLWVHESKLKIALKIFVYVICAGVPALFFLALSKFVVSGSFAKYFLNVIGFTFAGLGLSYFAPMLTKKLKIMGILPGDTDQYVNDYE